MKKFEFKFDAPNWAKNLYESLEPEYKYLIKGLGFIILILFAAILLKIALKIFTFLFSLL